MARGTSPSKRKREAEASYLFRIERVQPQYSFGLNHEKSASAPYSEHLHPQFEATCLAPHELAGRTVSFTFIGDRKLTNARHAPAKTDFTPISVGRLTMRGRQSNFLGSLPFDAALSLPTLALLKGYQFIYLSGSSLHRGSADIRYIAFHQEYDPNDL